MREKEICPGFWLVGLFAAGVFRVSSKLIPFQFPRLAGRLDCPLYGVSGCNKGELMHATVTKENNRALVRLSGRFDFNTHREFRNAVEPLANEAAVTQVVIDFTDVEYLDSSALGMLLMLRDRMNVAKKGLTIAGVHGNVKQVLEIANFGQLFHIVE